MYELDDKLLPAQGAPVQCSKCQFVFKAYPVKPPHASPTNGAGDPGEPLAPLEPSRRRTGDLVREGGSLASSNDYAFPEPSSGTPRTPMAPPSERAAPSQPSSPGGAGPVAPPPEAGDVPRFTADGRPIRKVPFPTSEPPYSGPRQPPAPPVPNPRRAGAARVTRLVLAVVILLVILVALVLGWSVYRGSGSRARDGQSRIVPQGGTPEAPPRK